MNETTFRNPIIPGFYPDPSICRVGENYWLVTSTFSYFPGVPVFHSRDLVNWEQVGHVLDRPSQLDLDGVQHSHGIFAPTIRFHEGRFYVITTLVGKKGNFIVTATDPAGPWSEPHWLEDAPGIDPSLFFDEDGRVWVTGTANAPDGTYPGDNEIWMRELDPVAMQVTGSRYGLWRGAAKNAHYPEAPHLYRVGGWYYLLIAEGGTEYHHAVTIARSKSLFGPYVGNPANPILTHRHLGKSAPIWNAGHADLVQTPAGEWWMVCLASRPYGGHFRNLGRETFLAPVIWEDEWPVVSPGTGKLEARYAVPQTQGKETTQSTATTRATKTLPGTEAVTPVADCLGEAGCNRSRPSDCGGCAGRTGGCCGTRKQTGSSEDEGTLVTDLPGSTYVCDFDGFDAPQLAPAFNFLRTPRETWWSLTERPGHLRIRMRPVTLGEIANPSFIGRRQQHMTFTVTAEMTIHPTCDGQASGLALLQSDAYHIRFLVVLSEGALFIRLLRCDNGEVELLAEAELAGPGEWPQDGLRLMLRVEAEEQNLRFLCGLDENRLAILEEGVDARLLSTDVAGGFVGTYLGMLAEGENPEGTGVVDFDSFSYEGC